MGGSVTFTVFSLSSSTFHLALCCLSGFSSSLLLHTLFTVRVPSSSFQSPDKYSVLSSLLLLSLHVSGSAAVFLKRSASSDKWRTKLDVAHVAAYVQQFASAAAIITL